MKFVQILFKFWKYWLRCIHFSIQWQYVITYVVVAPQNIVIKFNSGKKYTIFFKP